MTEEQKGSGERRTSVTVRIAGEEHTIRASAEPEYTRSCAHYVDERIGEIRSRSGLLEAHKAAILAALSISDELFQLREELGDLRREVASRATNLAHRLESAAVDPIGSAPAEGDEDVEDGSGPGD